MSHQFKTLEEVKQLFSHWRSTRTKRGKVPIHLWQHVKPLKKHHNISTIAQALGLNTKTLKENLTPDESSHFVEVCNEVEPPMSIITNLNELPVKEQTCAIELHHPNGSILKISALPQNMLSTLITQFTC
jgi:hypothetical protein